MFFCKSQIAYPIEILEKFCMANWGKENPEPQDIQRAGKSLKNLWEKLALLRGISDRENHYAFKKDQVDAYTSYYLPANALKTALIAEEAFLTGNDILQNNSIWLDLGTGPGTALWGLEWWAQKRNKSIEFHGWDQSNIFLQKASALSEKKLTAVKSIFHRDHQQKKDLIPLIKKVKPTHISLMNSIAEIFPNKEERISYIQRIWDELISLGGERFLIIIEPGSKDSSRELAILKGSLKNANILLPCTDNRACGALTNSNDWCHEDVQIDFPKWFNDLGEEANMRKESMLFSYSVISNKPILSRQAPLARMVSQRMERKGQTECFFCFKDGKKKLRVQNSKLNEENKFFLEIGRGDLFEEIDFAEKGDIQSAKSAIKTTQESIFKKS